MDRGLYVYWMSEDTELMFLKKFVSRLCDNTQKPFI